MKTNKEPLADSARLAAAGCAHHYLPEEKWRELCARYLPITFAGSMWRYSRVAGADDPEQGWKLHISATVLTACRALEVVGPLLRRRRVFFKAPATLLELSKLNSGIDYGYSQVGKFLTVYPRTTAEALRLARRLHQLTYGLAAPSVPFDLKFRPDSCVHYRYGSFRLLEIENPDGTRTHAVRDPQGRLVPDRRDAETAHPPWVTDPFALKRCRADKAAETLLRTRFRAFAAMAQRGKGGVYQAVDLGPTPARFCALKEGRRDGEVWWDGRDGYARTEHEAHVLAALRAAGVNVPRVYSSFRAGRHFYMALEFIEGSNFEGWLAGKKRRLTVARALRYGLQVAELLVQVHAAGWVWRDCKPANLVLLKTGELRPLDFEGACPIDRPDPVAWSSPFYAPPECAAEFRGQSRQPEDFYALGALLYILLTGRVPDAPTHLPLPKLRRNIPARVSALVGELLAAEPGRRPDAATATRRLKAALAALPRRTRGPEGERRRVSAPLVKGSAGSYDGRGRRSAGQRAGHRRKARSLG